MKSFYIGDLEIRVPIIQGGMGVGISLSGLASAVANEGGVGVISCAGLGLIYNNLSKNTFEAAVLGLRQEIRKAKKLSDGIIGVNIMNALTDFESMVKTAVEEKVNIIFSGAGLPLDLPKFLKADSITKLVPIVSSARAAKLLCTKWKAKFNYLPDAFVVEGPKAGGHLGYKEEQLDDPDFTLEAVVPQVVEEVGNFEEKYQTSIPVIAGGGLKNGEDIYQIFKKGAKGAQLGSRFVVTNECDASEEFKQSYINASEDDVTIIHSPVGMPGRAIKNSFLEQVQAGLKVPKNCAFNCIKTCVPEKSPYCIMAALFNAFRGKMESGFVFAGQYAYQATEIVSVKELFQELIQEYQEAEKKDLQKNSLD